jgi:putative alpha-1,2-mannosidase
VGSPIFPKAVIHLRNGKSIQIDGDHASASNPYVQRLVVNAKAYDSPWSPWKLLSDGGVVRFYLGPNPSDWGTRPSDAPPSFDGP